MQDGAALAVFHLSAERLPLLVAGPERGSVLLGCRLGPKDAYRFAKGEEVTASMGERVRLSRPLDFLVVTDHSDNLGFFPQLLAGHPKVLADPPGTEMV